MSSSAKPRSSDPRAGLTRPVSCRVFRTGAPSGGIAARFLAATGPAAIATLFVASVLPQFWPVPRDLVPLAAGVLATVGGFWPRRSVVAGTLVGAAGYAAAFWLIT